MGIEVSGTCDRRQAIGTIQINEEILDTESYPQYTFIINDEIPLVKSLLSKAKSIE
jgi:hypothetical protein